MKIFLIVLASIFGLLGIIVVSSCLFMFNSSFKRIKDSDQVLKLIGQNNSDQWSPFMDELIKRIDEFKKEELEEIYINSFDGLKLHARLKKVNNEKNFIVAVHGYAQDCNEVTTISIPFKDNVDFNILYVDLRGHGKSSGKYVTFGSLDCYDIVEWEKYLINRFGTNINLFFYGISMGAATVLLASNKLKNTKGIIADCGFTSGYKICEKTAIDMVGKIGKLMMYFEWMTVKTFGHFDIRKENTINCLKESKIPVLFIHGEIDKFVPISMTYENIKACKSKHIEIIYKDSGHALNYIMHRDDYLTNVLKFIEENSND